MLMMLRFIEVAQMPAHFIPGHHCTVEIPAPVVCQASLSATLCSELTTTSNSDSDSELRAKQRLVLMV